MSEVSVLLFDAGNTRVKWAVSRSGQLLHHGVHAYANGALAPALDAAFASASDEVGPILTSTALLGSVASDLVNTNIMAWLASREVAASQVHVHKLERLRVAYDDPSKLGVDRWLAMLGARALSPTNVVVADCGTALTLDSVDASGQHLGGLIAPGYALMQQALLTQTARIDAADQPMPESIFGDSTGSAVNAGATYALAALLDRFVEKTSETTGENPVVLVTGGGRERLSRYAHSDVIEVPDLVLLGLSTLTASEL